MAVDVAPLEGGGYKVIELNTGSDSGVLESGFNTPLMGRPLTGRSTPAFAAAGGLLAGGVAAGATGAGQALVKHVQSKKELS